MPVEGTQLDHPALNQVNLKAMCTETVHESTKKLKSLIKAKTPVDEGVLKASWYETPITHPFPKWYVSSVVTDVSYGPHVEFGTRPHVIEPKNGKALKFNGEFYARVNHPGYEGAHMVQRSAAEFEDTHAEIIANRIANKHLQA